MSDSSFIVEGPPRPNYRKYILDIVFLLVFIGLILAAPTIYREATRKFSDADLARLERELLTPHVKSGGKVNLKVGQLKNRRGKLILVVPSIWSESGKAELDPTHEWLPEDVRADSIDKVGTVVFVHRMTSTQNVDYQMQTDQKVKNFKVDTTRTTVFVFDRVTKNYFGGFTSSGAPKDKIMVKKDQTRVDAGGGSQANSMVKFLTDIDKPRY